VVQTAGDFPRLARRGCSRHGPGRPWSPAV